MTMNDYTYVDPIPDELLCVVCCFPAHEPQQTECCGKVYCRSCLETYYLANKTGGPAAEHPRDCSICWIRLKSFPDKISQRRINALKVKCSNGKEGCSWTGELGDLELHLPRCEYEQVPCANKCGELLLVAQMQRHLHSECLLRSYSCPLCNEEGTYQEITSDHPELCPNVIVGCPNPGCPFSDTRAKISHHSDQDCPKLVVACPYCKVGCVFSCPREAMAEHKAASVQAHLDLAMECIAPQNVAPLVVRMVGVSQLMEKREPFVSPPFYSHLGGYKLCFTVLPSNPRGSSKAAFMQPRTEEYLSVTVFLMEGANDDRLLIPFRGEVTLSLLNQLEDDNHWSKTVFFNKDKLSTPPKDIKGMKGFNGRGYPKFIAVDKLGGNEDTPWNTSCQYLLDNTLYFSVSVVVDTQCKPWLGSIN